MLGMLPGCSPLQFSPGKSVVPPAGQKVPVVLAFGGIPCFQVQGTRAEGKPLMAVLDTGASMSFISMRLAEADHPSISTTYLHATDAQGKTRENLRLARVDQVKLGDASFEQFDAVVDDTGALPAVFPRLDLLLALPVFKDVLLTIDYPHETLSVESGSLPPPNGKDILPLREDDNGHLLMPVKLLGEEVWLMVDTGHSGQGILLSRYRLLAMKWASTPVEGYTAGTMFGTSAVRIGRMEGDVTLGAFSIRRPIVGISLDDDIEVIGSVTLRNFSVTIDQKNKRIRLQSPVSSPIEVPPLRRAGFSVSGKNYVIKLDRGSAAASAGMKDGDELVSINGTPVENLTIASKEAIESRSLPFVVHVKRNGQELVLLVPVTVVVP